MPIPFLSTSTSAGSHSKLPKHLKNLSIPTIPSRFLTPVLRFDLQEKDAEGMPMTCRAVFVIKPDKTLASSILYPATTGRNFQEVLRLIDSLQLTAKHSVATPADWCTGRDCMVAPALSDEEASAKFPGGFRTIQGPSKRGYLRVTGDPSG